MTSYGWNMSSMKNNKEPLYSSDCKSSAGVMETCSKMRKLGSDENSQRDEPLTVSALRHHLQQYQRCSLRVTKPLRFRKFKSIYRLRATLGNCYNCERRTKITMRRSCSLKCGLGWTTDEFSLRRQWVLPRSSLESGPPSHFTSKFTAHGIITATVWSCPLSSTSCAQLLLPMDDS